MASNRFGDIFTLTTFGESHGIGVGALIDGCPSLIPISIEEIESELKRRRPGHLPFTSERKESDQVEILSGVFEGKTTGAPILLFIKNRDVDSSSYEVVKDILKPGHGQFTYLEKYGIFDYRGSGRASARETVARVAAGAIAKKFIWPTEVRAQVIEVGGERDSQKWNALLQRTKDRGDSVGGIIECLISSPPKGLGDPIYQKLSAELAFAMFSIPAVKGMEFGSGFQASSMTGSVHNDPFVLDEEGEIIMDSNHHGGILAGISTGMPIQFSLHFKPTSSIKISQKSVRKDGIEAEFELPKNAKHDPCIVLRASVIVESMASLVLADAILKHRCTRA